MNAKLLITALGVVCVSAAPAWAQTSGTVSKAVGGYSFDEASKPSPDTPNFHSNDGKLTFAIITHTAGNGFFDPTYARCGGGHGRRQPDHAGLGGAGRRRASSRS